MANPSCLSTLTMAIAFGIGAVAAFAGSAAKAEAPPRVGEAINHANLSVYFLRGPSAAGAVPLTLAEALVKGTVSVHETGEVNQLEVENTGQEEVFVQAGDIVKGGQQDRVLTVSLVLAARPGRIPIGAFCVEQGRWSARGKEDSKRFASADKAVPSREAKLAMLAPVKRPETPTGGLVAPAGEPSRVQQLRSQARGLGQSELGSRQSEVWANVGKIQEKLSSNLNAKVASGQSSSSLQLSLENDALTAVKAAYLGELKSAGEADADIVGVAFAINGRISSAEIYPSNGLFRKMWSKLIDAAATEAIGEKQEAVVSAPTAAAVAAFMASADAGKAQPEVSLAPGLLRHAVDGTNSLAVATRRRDGFEFHRMYLAK